MAKGFPKNHKLVFFMYFYLKSSPSCEISPPKKTLKLRWKLLEKIRSNGKKLRSKFSEKVEKLRFLCVCVCVWCPCWIWKKNSETWTHTKFQNWELQEKCRWGKKKNFRLEFSELEETKIGKNLRAWLIHWFIGVEYKEFRNLDLWERRWGENSSSQTQ